MKGIQEKILKPIIIVAVIIALTMVDFIAIGEQVITYAIGDEQVTNVNNVLFMATFLDENGNQYESIESDMNNENIKLRLAVQVAKEGYFNGEIHINNSNFKLKTDINNPYINSISENSVKLNQIVAGEEVVLDIGIQVVKDDKYPLEFLNKVSEIQLLGTYVMGKNSEKEIKATRQVALKLNSKNSNENVQSNVKVVTNKVYEINGQNKRVVQLETETKLSENNYPIKSTKMEIDVLEGTEQVEISKRGTYATNNDSQGIESNWNKENNKVEIGISNIEQDGKIEWNKNGSDKILITYILPENTNVINKQISMTSKIELYDANNTNLESGSNVIVEQEQDGIIDYELTTLESIYKGNLYYGEETKLVTQSIVDVRLKQVANEIVIKEGNGNYINGDTKSKANLKYNSTKVNKDSVKNILGDSGRIEILSEQGQTLSVINKESVEQTESDKIEIGYEAQSFITIKLIDIENEGKLVFENTQVLQEDANLKSYLKQINKMEILASLQANKNVSAKETSKLTELKEPESYAEFKSNVSALATLQTNENVEFNVILKTDDIKYDLYKNPTINIEFPQEITNISASFNAVFLDGLEVTSAEIYNTDSGNKAMKIQLEGEQTSHSNNISEGIVININANIDVSKTASTKDTELKMTYTNENSQGNVYEQKLPIQLKSKDGLLVYNKIENYNSNGDIIETEEAETLNKTISEDSNGKEANANTVFVNNYAEQIENVAIVLKNSDNSTMDLNILNPIVENKDSQISYSENGQDWTQNAEELQNVKVCKIEAGQMAASETMLLDYNLKLPEQLESNKMGKLEQNVTYTYQGQELSQNFGLELQTDIEPIQTNSEIVSSEENEYTEEVTGELQVDTITKLGTKELSEEDSVYEGETIKNIITISNKTGRDLTNVNIKVNQENAVIYDLKEKEVVNPSISDDSLIEHSYEELDTGEKSFETIETIKSGEIIKLQYETVIKQVEGSDEKTYGNIEITADDMDNISKQTIENSIKQAEIKVNSKFTLNEEVKLYSNYAAGTKVLVENISGNELKNVNVKMQLFGLSIEDENDIKFYDKDMEDFDENEITDIKYNKEENTITFKINKLSANEQVLAVLTTIANAISLEKNSETAEILTTVTTESNNTYNSNVASRKIIQTEKDITIKQETNLEEGKILQDGDIFNIKVTINNNTTEESDYSIEDILEDVFEINSIKMIKDGQETEIEQENYEDNIFKYEGNISAKSQIEFEINVTVVDSNELEDLQATNIVELSFEDDQYSSIYSNELEFSFKEIEDEDNGDDDDDYDYDENNNNNNEGNNNNSNNQEEIKKHTISGVAWLDKNKDGKINSNEQKISGLQVKLADKNTGKFIENSDIQTGQDGKYTFSIENGEYIAVFLYDEQKYNLTEYKKAGVDETENSDAISKNVTIDNVEKIAGITDTIKIENSDINNINIGLVEKEIFDLKLDKYVSKISVANKQGTKVYEYNNEQLAKVDIHSKYYQGSTIAIEYKIVVTNEGEIEGYASEIVDYLPAELKFNSELNKNWYVSNDGSIHNTSLSNEKIKAGETKNITLVLTKVLDENEAGLISNTAEICKSSNNSNIADRDSKPGNRATGEDDISTAGAIISIGTGIVKICIIGIFIILAIIGVVIIIMKRKEGEKSEKDNK